MRRLIILFAMMGIIAPVYAGQPLSYSDLKGQSARIEKAVKILMNANRGHVNIAGAFSKDMGEPAAWLCTGIDLPGNSRCFTTLIETRVTLFVKNQPGLDERTQTTRLKAETTAILKGLLAENAYVLDQNRDVWVRKNNSDERWVIVEVGQLGFDEIDVYGDEDDWQIDIYTVHNRLDKSMPTITAIYERSGLEAPKPKSKLVATPKKDIPEVTGTCDLRPVFALTKSLPREVGKIVNAGNQLTEIKGAAADGGYLCKGLDLPDCASCHVVEESGISKTVIQIPYASSNSKASQLLSRGLRGVASQSGFEEFPGGEAGSKVYRKSTGGSSFDQLTTQTVSSGDRRIARIELAKGVSEGGPSSGPEVFSGNAVPGRLALRELGRSLQSIMAGSEAMTAYQGASKSWIRPEIDPGNPDPVGQKMNPEQYKPIQAFDCKGLNLADNATCTYVPETEKVSARKIEVVYHFDSQAAAERAQDVILESSLNALSSREFKRNGLNIPKNYDFRVLKIQNVEERKLYREMFGKKVEAGTTWDITFDEVIARPWNGNGKFLVIVEISRSKKESWNYDPTK